MQRIIDGDSQDDRADADDDNRHTVMEQGQSAHGEQPSPGDGKDDERDVADAAQGEKQQRHDERHGNHHREDAVRLDLRSVPDGYHRTADDMHVDAPVLCQCPLPASLQHSDEACIVLRLACAVGRVEHHDGPLHIGREDVAVIKLIPKARVGTLKFLHDRREEVQRVALYVVRKDIAGREHQQLLVLLQLLPDVAGNTQGTVHAGIVMLGKEVRNVPVDEARHRSQLLKIHLRCEVLHDVRRISPLHLVGKSIHGGRQAVGIGLRRVTVLENGEDFIRTRYVLIHLQRIMMVAVDRQEVGYILLIAQPQHRRRQQQRDGHERQHARKTVPPQIII